MPSHNSQQTLLHKPKLSYHERPPLSQPTTQSPIVVFTKARQWSLSEPQISSRNFPSAILLRYILILSYPLCIGFLMIAALQSFLYKLQSYAFFNSPCVLRSLPILSLSIKLTQHYWVFYAFFGVIFQIISYLERYLTLSTVRMFQMLCRCLQVLPKLTKKVDIISLNKYLLSLVSKTTVA